MLVRRTFLLSAVALSTGVIAPALRAGRAYGHAQDYATFVAGVRDDAIRQGLDTGIANRALDLSTPNAQVLRLDRTQPEFHLTWAQYRQRVITARKIADGRTAVAVQRALLDQALTRYNVAPGAIAGIWGLESAYGTRMGTFGVIDALCTLAYDGRRAKFFHDELMKALHILGMGDIAPEQMIGSYAGAMGQPQFMPSAYLRYAVDMDGDGRRDIWHSTADVFGSIASYLSHSGWIGDEPWGQQVTVPDTLAQAALGRTHTRTLQEWMDAGVRQIDGSAFPRADMRGAILRPDGVGGESFMVYRNFNAIRRYNPSDFYALAVGLLGNEIT
ncbi:MULTISPECIES: lytic transglycosylase domain-containing protein [Novacetimonas]|uniref:lytic murein transglycosylase n=1 Tax=Novacetimonas TaxID=2919364 RepID=UPI000789AF03|nr:lytic murein transglycosylase [Novacetimonas hansenii]RFO99025.1 lytic transglycosylase [Novacetimonas hansenii]WEQ59202.1 lytic murein transglycosylase [Novacetimonas hansenii]CUW47260.1 Membrane-bound lytic murein transglycosylase B precursor [Novacetimonas hansenii]